ncbi:MAG: hypothetical protein L3K23_07565 [Thermoplasmata archaeon]|nr:hypothetical protein [Thermoplasmata archaeon]
MKSRTFQRLAEVTVGLFVIALVLGEVALVAPPTAPKLVFQASLVSVGPRDVELNFTATATFVAHLRQLWLVQHQAEAPGAVYFFYDAAYPVYQGVAGDWFSLAVRLQNVLRASVPGASLQLVDAPGLASFMVDPAHRQGILVLASGVLPDTVFDRTHDLLLPWIQQGGSAIWVGAPIGEWVGHRGTPGSAGAAEYLGPSGSNRLVPTFAFGGTGFLYTNGSSPGFFLGGQYPYGRPGDDLAVGSLVASNGTVVGGVSAGYTNLAELAVGNGSLFYVGVPLAVPNLLGNLLVELMVTGVAFGTVPIVATAEWTLRPGSTLAEFRSEVIPPPTANAPSRVCVYTFQSDYLATFGDLTCLPWR